MAILVHAYELHDRSARPASRRRHRRLRVLLEHPDLWTDTDVGRDLSIVLERFFGVPLALDPVAAEAPARVALTMAPPSRPAPRGHAHAPSVFAFSPALDSIAAVAQHLAHAGAERDLVIVAVDLLDAHHPRRLAPERLLGRLFGKREFHLCTLAVRPPDPQPLAPATGALRNDWSLLRVVAAAAVAMALDLPQASFFENGIDNLRLPITMSVLANTASRSVHADILAALNRLLARIGKRPFRLRNPFLTKTPAEIVESLLPPAATGGIADVDEIHSLVENENEPERCIDQRISTLGARLDAPAHGKSDLGVLAPELTNPINENIADAYMRAIRELPALPDRELLSRIAPAGLAQNDADDDRTFIVDLFRRHTEDVRRTLAEITARYARHLVAGTLAPSCLLIRATMPGQVRASEPSWQPTFRKRTDRWEIWFEQGEPIYLNHSKGLEYIHLLLQQPGMVHTATDLRAQVSGHYGVPSGTLGATADKKAIRSYKTRLDDLRTELDQATEQNDLGRVQRLQDDIEAIQRHLRACLDLAGRPREATDADRTRKAVSIAIRRTLNRLREVHPSLARHLDGALHIGFHLNYLPDPPIAWIT